MRIARKLAGWTQERLAREASVSISLIGQVERGAAPPSAAFLKAVASALSMSESDLLGPPTFVGEERPHVAELETAVLTGSAGASETRSPDRSTLAKELAHAFDLRTRTRYDRLASMLPNLLAALAGASAKAGVAERADTDLMLAQAYNHARSCLLGLGSTLASLAAERATDAAMRAQDPVLVSVLLTNRALALNERGAVSAASVLAEAARDELAGQSSTPAVLAARGYSHLQSAMAAAHSSDMTTSALHIREADECASRLPAAANLHGTAFNADSVAAHAVTRAVELGDGAGALSLPTPTGAGMTPSRRAHHHIDLARAASMCGDRARVLAEFGAAKRASPHITRYHPAVTSTVRALASTDRRRTDGLTPFARWAGVRS